MTVTVKQIQPRGDNRPKKVEFLFGICSFAVFLLIAFRYYNSSELIFILEPIHLIIVLYWLFS